LGFSKNRKDRPMRIGTIGAGEVALAVAREALARGHEIVLSSRSGPGALADRVSELGRGASAGTVEEAAGLDYVLLAVPWSNVEPALRGLPDWSGRVLIDATNPFVETSPNSFLPTSVVSGPARLWPVSR
jgi:8-hydroxy-5-deazaflavin:NADPH oxidoreductase